MNVDFFLDCTGTAYTTVFPESASKEFSAWQPIPRVVPDACEDYSIGPGDLRPTQIGVLFGTAYITITDIYLTLTYVKQET